jgi:hypothetical protein
VANSTFTGNSRAISNSATMRLAGNIFAESSGINCYTVGSTLNDNGYNLSDDSTCTNSGDGSRTNVTLNLGALADNGGDTLTHLPEAGSDAIGAIPNGTTISNGNTSWTCNQTFTDQRGESRPIDSGGDCTAGAVEVSPLTPQEAIADIQDEIDGLVDDGVLKKGQANGLTQPLDNAIRSLNKGKTAAACNQLADFIAEVNAKTPAPLDAATAADLIADAQAIQTAIGCP